MSHHYVELARKTSLAVFLALACGAFTACTDDYKLDDPDNYPSWLGGSIYEAMEHPENLTNAQGNVLKGTFKNYLRLIDDLGYAETLSKTGSKTVFPANDEAFDRFYANNQWGVRKYEDLTVAMKKQLLYASMLDNAILVEMLSNISENRNGLTTILQGQSLKHTTGANVIDTITHLRSQADMPPNNKYWEKYYDKGIYMVMDATRPMMVHFTEEQMTTNNITTRGDLSDFEVVTGTPYDEVEKSAYIFRDKIITSDVTCKNGYIHQMEDVLLPPGNLAEVIRNNGESNLFSRMLDRFSAPFYDASTTQNYNNYAVQNGLQEVLAEKLGKISGYDSSHLFLCNSGAEANENALKLASFHTGRAKVLAFGAAFHGRTSGAVSVTDNPKIRAPFNETDKVTFVPLGDLEAVKKELDTQAYAAVIIEGIQGVAGIRVPDDSFLKGLRALCDQTGTLLVADEIQSGCGRTGKFFAHQHAGVKADLITMAKGLAGGIPIGAVLINPVIQASYGLLGTTFGGNHIACAAAIAVLEVMEQEKLMAHATKLGEWFEQQLKGDPALVEYRGRGLMIGLEIKPEFVGLRDRLLKEKHIFTGASGERVIRLLPALNLPEESARKFVEAWKDLTK